MHKVTGRLLITVFAFTLIQLAGCKKKPDVLPPHEVDLCHISHVKYSFSGSNFEANFTYNPHDNPVSITVSSTGTGNPNALFYYDKYNRITDFIEPYAKLDPENLPAEFTFEFWVRFTYADQNPASMPVVDTSRTFGIYSNGQFKVVTPVNIEQYSYDSKGRISQIKSQSYTLTYNYNANGNLVLPNVVYDNKISFRRTNRLWMLLDRDYSENNPFTATTYNDKGLPTVIPNKYTNFMHRGLNLAAIDYSCKTNSD